jgi:hypothetical protein
LRRFGGIGEGKIGILFLSGIARFDDEEPRKCLTKLTLYSEGSETREGGRLYQSCVWRWRRRRERERGVKSQCHGGIETKRQMFEQRNEPNTIQHGTSILSRNTMSFKPELGAVSLSYSHFILSRCSLESGTDRCRHAAPGPDLRLAHTVPWPSAHPFLSPAALPS